MVDDKLTVSELMTTSLIALPPVVPVRRLVDTLRMCSHQVGGWVGGRGKVFGVGGAVMVLLPPIVRPCLIDALRMRSHQVRGRMQHRLGA